MDQIQLFISQYGYIAIFLLLLCGLIGIPIPEESMMIFIGITVSQGTLNPVYCIISAFLGVFSGMFIAYTIGRRVGLPFVNRFGKYIGLTEKRWNKASTKFEKYAVGAVAIGYFIPGVRQINPYLSGISRVRLLSFSISAGMGAAIWTTTFILLGKFLGYKIEKYLSLTPAQIAVGFLCFFILVILFVVVHFIIVKKRTS